MLTKDETFTLLTTAKENLIASITAEFEASDVLLNDQKLLKKKRQEIINQYTDPKELGANEAAREAKICELLADRISLVELNECIVRVHRNATEIARLEHQFARDVSKLVIGREEL